MELFGKMELNTYLCRAKKERDGLRHQRYITQTGYRTLPEFAKKETLRIIPQQFQARQHDTVQLTYPNNVGSRRNHLSEIRWKTFFVVFAISLRLLPLHAADELHDGAIYLGGLGHHKHDGLGI